jgi:hypothetical protein
MPTCKRYRGVERVGEYSAGEKEERVGWGGGGVGDDQDEGGEKENDSFGRRCPKWHLYRSAVRINLTP